MLAQSAETINNRAKLLMHRLIVRRLRQQPGLVLSAQQQLLHDANSGRPLLDCHAEWQDLLALDLESLCRVLVSRDERMTRLRINSPFNNTINLTDVDLRRRIWRKASLGSFVMGSNVRTIHNL